MPTFSNMRDLEKYLNSSGGQKILFGTKGMKTILLSEAKRLKRCIQKRLNEYYASYTPSFYASTGDLKNALRIDDTVKVSLNGTQFSVEISFDDEYVEAESQWGGTTYNKAALINYGWEVKADVPWKDTEHFGWQNGFNFIGKGIDDFEACNPYGIKVSRPQADKTVTMVSRNKKK